MKFIKKIFSKIFSWFKQKFGKKIVTSASRPKINTGVAVIDLEKDTSVLDVDLLDDNASEKDKKTVRQYTKMLITALTVFACIWISWSYVLSTVALVLYGNAEPMSTLSEKVCEVILGAVIAYCLKAFFETFAQKGMELLEQRFINNDQLNIENDLNENKDIQDNEPVG